MSKIIVNIVGLSGSGKTHISEYLETNFGFFIYKTSEVLKDYAQKNGIKLNGRSDYVKCHELLNRDDPLAIIRPILKSRHQRICLDGMRAPAPFLYLRKQLGAVLIFLDVPTEARFKRINTDRKRSGHRIVKTVKELNKDESIDYSNDPYLPNVNRMREIADYKINADQPLDIVIKDIKKILRKEFNL